jgi:uncharacterized protein
MPSLARINVYPIKSFDGQSVEEALILSSGAIENDRRFALYDRSGEWINGKRTPAMHRLRSSFDLQAGRIELKVEGEPEAQVFDLNGQRSELTQWLAAYFDLPLEIVENAESGFPDDTESPGPTLISIATLEEVGRWFDGLPLAEVRRRFRANLEIEGVEPFWEDRLVGDSYRSIRFRVGKAELIGTNPCARCIVPTRESTTGEMTPRFSKTFQEHRRESLPAWAPTERFDHFYRLALNTRPATGQSCTIRVGDEVTILGPE